MVAKKVAFVIGTGRSGSTLLGLLLGSHSHIFNLGELISMPQRLQPLPEADGKRVICRGVCLADPCPYWNDRADLSVLQRYFGEGRAAQLIARTAQQHRSIYQYLFDWFEHAMLLDVSKRVEWVERQLHPRRHWRTMQPHLIYLVRDGRAVINSQHRKWSQRDDAPTLSTIAHEWVRDVQAFNAYYAQSPHPKITVHYEDLALDPAATLTRLCDFLGVDYEPPMLTYWQHDHHFVSGNAAARSIIMRYRAQEDAAYAAHISVPDYMRDHYQALGLNIELDLRWQDELSPQQQDQIEAIIGPTNAPFAYTP